MLERRYLGVDIGSYSIKLVEYERGLRDGRFTRAVEVTLPPKATPPEVAEALAAALAEHRFSLDCAVCALAGMRVTQRHLRLPITGKQVAGAVRLEIEESVPVPLEQLVLTHESVVLRPDQTDVLAVLAPRGDVEQRLSLAREGGLEPRHLEIEGAVLANLCGGLALGPTPRVFLDIGHSKTHVCLVAKSKPLLLRSIPVAGQHFTEALAEELGVGWLEAETHKRRSGLFKIGTTAPSSLRVGVLLEQLVRETLRTLQSLVSDSVHPESPAEVLLMGGSAQLPGLAAYTSERLGLPCRVLEVPEGTPGTAPLTEGRLHVLAQAAALALRGSSARTTHMDMRQDEFRYVPDLSALWPQVQWTALLLGVLLLLWPVSLAAQLWGATRELNGFRAAIADLQEQIFPGEPVAGDAMASFNARYEETRSLADHLGVTGTGASPLELLRRISAGIPDSLEVSLSDLRIERKSIRALGFAPDAAAANQLEQLLRQIEVFQSVTIGDLTRQAGSGNRPAGFSFNLTIELLA